MPPSNSSSQSEALKRNKHCPRILAAASKRSTCARVQIGFPDDGHHASARTVGVVPTADSRTEKLLMYLNALGPEGIRVTEMFG